MPDDPEHSISRAKRALTLQKKGQASHPNFEASRLFRLTPSSQLLAELASFASGQSQTVGFIFIDLTLLSHGEPHVIKTTNLQMKNGPLLRPALFAFRGLAMSYNVLQALLSITSWRHRSTFCRNYGARAVVSA